MKIKHEHIRMAMNAWARPDGEKVPAAEITRVYFELGMTFPELYDDSHPEALARNTQKIFRWVEKDTPDAVEKIQALLPAIEKAMPPLLVARMRSHSSALMNPLMILVKIIKLRWIHILSYDQMVSRKINNQTTRCANSI
ncbi:toxin YdaT family protein, partial [Escherichia coli]|uniref:toxin YdaT family protein n=1 Tax=Escherichia coli TaxID=562 RepID=UPI00203BE2E8